MTKVIVFDAGHRKGTPGKRTPDDEREWVFNDKMLRAAVAHLNARYKGFKVVRTDDPNGEKEVSLAQRVKRANDSDGDVFVSFHNNANSGKWGSHGGTETFVPSPASSNPKSMALAKEVHPRMQKAFGLRDRGIKAGNLYVIMNTNMPSILLEGAFMDSTTDIEALRDDDKLREVGEAIAEGAAAYLDLEKKTEPSPKPIAPQVVKPPSNAVKIGSLITKQDVPAYARPEWGTQTGQVVGKGQNRHVYARKDGWYQLFSGEWLPSQSGANFDYLPVKKPDVAQAPPKLKRVIVDGKQVGAFSQADSVLRGVSEALDGKAKTITIKDV